MKTGAEDKQCCGCPDRQGCGRAYERLGRSKQQISLVMIFTAFLLPLLVFAGVLYISQKGFAELITNADTRVLVGFLSAAGAALVVVSGVKAVLSRFQK